MKVSNGRGLTEAVRIIRIGSLLTVAALAILASGSLIAGRVSHVEAAGTGTSLPAMLSARPVTLFGPGSLIIPMDTSASGQDNGMLRAYGLVYQLLRNGVQVHWMIDPSKTANGDDFTVAGGSSIQDLRTGSPVAAPRSYRGGPFVIDSSNAASAMPVIAAWQATAGDNTTVHRLTFGSIVANDARLLVTAPRIAILKDGNETIAFNDLNAAGIADSTGGTWTSSSPDLLTEADVAGVTTSSHNDGVLFHQASGLPRYSYLASMHYNTSINTPEVIAEVRSWLGSSSLTHGFMQCEAARVFENDPAGLFLTTAGIADDGNPTTTPVNRVPWHPLTQMDGVFVVDSGAVDSIGLAGGSTFKTGVQTLINESSATFLTRIVMLTGRMDGNPGNGKVTYLAGHDYALDMPVSANPQTNGVRLFLNTIFESDAASATNSDVVSVSKTAPATTNLSQIPYTINYSTTGSRPAENLTLTDTLPPGTTYVAGSANVAPSSVAGNVLTWNLPPLAPGGSGNVTFSVNVSTDGTYTNRAKLNFSNLAVGTVTSAPATTVRDTSAPSVTITSGPSGPTNNVTPSFRFTADASAVSKACAIDNVGFTACSPDPASYTSSALTEGPHTFYVRATDAAGNVGTATRSFTVDLTPPVITITTGPSTTNSTMPTFEFTVGGGPATTECRFDSGAFAPCVSPFMSPVPLTNGAHTFNVRATDAAGNVGTASRTFTVDIVPPDTTITPLDPNPSSNVFGHFVFAATETSTFECKIDTGVFAACPSSFTTPALTNGTHTIYARAIDAAGNVDPTPASYSWTINTTPVLVSITLTPVNPSIPAGRNLQFTATGTYADGSNRDLTALVAWSSASRNIAVISNASSSTGVATGIAQGTSQIRAALGSVSGATNITVTPAVLVSINVTPVNPSVAVAFTRQLTATGTFSDGSQQDLTATAAWSSGSTAIATVSNAAGSNGLAFGVSAGVTQIAASVGSIIGSTTLTVTGTLRASKQAVRTELNNALATATNNKDKNNLKDAIKKLDDSLDPGLWLADGNHLACDHGNKVFGREKQAVKKLMAMIANTSTASISDAVVQRWINILVAIDRRLAQIAVSEATVSAQLIAAANQQMSYGDADANAGDFDKAITHYKRAWKKVRACRGDDDDEDDDDNCNRHDH